MEVIPGNVIVEPAGNRAAPQSQPVEALANLDAPLDDNQVRQAIAQAEANNQDPHTITLDDLAKVSQAPATVPVPEKFQKTDGTADVEKIQAATKQLDEGIQKKETAIKTVDDYMREYNERQKKFSSMPNAEKTLAQIPQAPVQEVPLAPVNQDFESIVRRDYAADPLGTTARLLDLMIEKKFQPLAEREKAEATRQNLQSLASKDPRILREDVFAAVNAKLQSDPELWKLKNPHKAAWLEVKEEMRLGESSPAQTQPSRPSPVLGGGTPPSVPSSSAPNPANVDFNSLDLRDKKQEALGDEAIRRLLMQSRG